MTKRVSDALLCAVVFLPLMGRMFFPRVRDKVALSLSASFSDPQIIGTYLLLLYVAYRILRKPSLLVNVSSLALAPFVMILVVAVTSVLASASPLFSLWRATEFAAVVFWGALVLDRIREGRSPEYFITAFYLMSGLMLISVALALWLDPANAWMLDETGVRRLSVTSSVSLMGAYTIGPMAALLALAAFARFVLKGKPYYLVFVGLGFWLMYASRSRTGFIVFAVGFLVCALYMLRIPGRSLMTSLSLFLAVVFGVGWVAVQPDVMHLVIITFTRGHDQTNLMGLDGRLSIWTAGLRSFSQSPLLGSGYGTYPAWIGSTGHFHNMFVELLVTVGSGGLLAALILLSLLLWHLVRLLLPKPQGSFARHILVLDGLLIGTMLVLANQTTAGAAYYSWELIGFVLAMICLPAILQTTSAPQAVILQEVDPAPTRPESFPLVSKPKSFPLVS